MKRAFFLLLFGGLALAGGFGASPPVVWETISPDSAVSGEVQVSLEPGSSVYVRLVDWRIDPNGNAEILPAGTLSRSLTPYLSFAEDLHELTGNTTLHYRIALPRDIEGCLYAGLLLQSEPQVKPLQGLNVRSRLSLLVPLFVNVQSRMHSELRLSDMRLHPTQLEGWLENTGNTCLHAKVTLIFLDAQGNVLGQDPVLQDYLTPGSLRKLTLPLNWPEDAVALQLRVESNLTQTQVWEVGR